MGELLRRGARVAAVLFAVTISLGAYGQAQMQDVANTFNQAVQMIKINPDAAITSFEKTIELADEVGSPEALDLKDQAIKQIPKMYWESARKLAGQKQYAESIEKLDKCVETAEVAEDESLISRASNTALSIINVQGNTAFTDGDYEAAIKYFDEAIARQADYGKAYLGKVLVYDKTGDLDKMEEVGLAGIDAATSARDNKTAGTIQQKLRSTFFNSAQEKFQAEDFAGAERCLQRSIEHGNNNAVTYYQLGLAYEGQEKWAEAIDAFNQSVELDLGSEAEKVKVYFKLATAYELSGDNAKACEFYKKCMVGDFAEAAQYKIESVLNCGN